MPLCPLALRGPSNNYRIIGAPLASFFSFWIHVLLGDIVSNSSNIDSHHFENHLGGFTYAN